MPDSRLVMGIQGGANGLVFKNNPADPMPIKIAGGKTLEQCVVEETEDYVLYSDGTPVVIQQYVSGTYDLYLERLNSESEAVPMLYVEREPIIDHAKLLQDINDAQLERLANEPMTIPDEEEYVAPILEPRTIPVPIDFCCRVDKKTGEIYIGEGYENYCKNIIPKFDSMNKNEVSGDLNYLKLIKKISEPTSTYHIKFLTINELGADFNFSFDFLNSTHEAFQIGLFNVVNSFSKVNLTPVLQKKRYFITNKFIKDDVNTGILAWFPNTVAVREEVAEVANLQLTKTSTPKPFIRTIMPSGKLSFVTDATSESHSFVVKDCEWNGVGVNHCAFTSVVTGTGSGNFRAVTPISQFKKSNCFISKEYSKTSDGEQFSIQDLSKVSGGYINMVRDTAYFYQGVASFKQLLIYKGNLTEAELKAENDKVIDLERWQPLEVFAEPEIKIEYVTAE